MSPETTKAVILARGLGTRMRKQDGTAALDTEQETIAASGIKAMIPIGRPFLDYMLARLADAGYRQVCLVIGPEHQVVRDYYTRTAVPTRLDVSFAVQEQPLGTANAVLAARSFAGPDHVLVLNSDNYYPLDACRALRSLGTAGVAVFSRDAMIDGGNVPPERVRQFAVVDIDGAGYLERIIEKPDEATLAAMGQHVYVSMNCWMFPPAIFTACERIGRSARGEFELTDAVQFSMSNLGVRFRVLTFDELVLDLSSRGDIAEVASRLKGVDVRL
jgi:glucose-1-phosphate thymidylyltransferase